MGRPPKYDWRDMVLPAGMAFVKSFRTGVTLRQCFYYLASHGFIANAGLPVSPFPPEKRKHSLIPRFQAKYGDRLEAMGLPRLVQFELDALPPDQLLALYQAAIDQFFDQSAYERSLRQEAVDRQELDDRWE
jgi:hypothetical protein